MARTDGGVPGTLTLTVTVEHDPVDAGATVSLVASAVCEPGCDLTGDAVLIHDAAGTVIGTLEFDAFDEASGASTGSLSLAAPATVGDHAWSAVVPAFAVDDLRFGETAAPIAFAVRAHRTRINVWDVPTAVPAGSRFSARIGVKCTCGCDLGGEQIAVVDESGRELAVATLPAEIWPGSDALHAVEVELPAAASAGRQTWEVRFQPVGLELPHEASTGRFGVVFTPAAEHVVKVEAVDRDSQQPLAGAIVTMHPYRALTDAQGIAELRVPKGTYTLFVSARSHVSDQAAIEVTSDVATRAALAVEVRPERV